MLHKAWIYLINTLQTVWNRTCFSCLQEIQKIVVFEGGFEKIFAIVKEEGGAEGGVVVQVEMNTFIVDRAFCQL